MRVFFHLCFVLLLTCNRSSASSTETKALAPLKIATGVRLCEGNYFVQLRENHTVEAHFQTIGIDLSQSASLQFHPVPIVDGYRAQFESQFLLDLVRQDPGVDHVRQNYYMSDGPDNIEEDDEPEVLEPEGSTENAVSKFTRRFWIEYIKGASWPNAMIAAGYRYPKIPVPLNGDWILSSQAGLGVDIYIMDTGINIGHEDFGGRASYFKGATITNYTMPPEPVVAGIAGADIYGAAPHANIINVKVEGRNGANVEGVVQAIGDIVDVNMYKKRADPLRYAGCVINMSFNVIDNEEAAVQKAINKAEKAGIVATVTAGNKYQPSQNQLCRFGATICVAACDRYYRPWREQDGENGTSYGDSVKIFAPGKRISSASVEGGKRKRTKSGTSMAAPMVAGVIASFTSHEYLHNDSRAIKDRLMWNSLNGALIDWKMPPNTNNTLLQNGAGQTRNSDIPYLGAPENNGGGWFTNHGPPGKELAVDSDPTNETAWQSIWIDQSTTVTVTGDLSTYTEPATADPAADDGFFEGSYWDDASGPPPFVDAGTITSSADPTTASSPELSRPTQLFTCNSGSNKFMSRDDMNDKIGKFCAEAAQQGVQDSNSGGIYRRYNTGSRFEVRLSIDWPPGSNITNMETDCKYHMTAIMDDCDGNDPNNPLNWKRGGNFLTEQAHYEIAPQNEQPFRPGRCSFHLQEDEVYVGVDGPGTERKHWYWIEKDTLRDGSGAVIGTLGFRSNGQDGVQVSAGDSNPLHFNSLLPYPIIITPESQGNPRDYIQFNYDTQAWTTSTNTGVTYCQTGGWSSDWSPIISILPSTRELPSSKI